MKMRRLLSVLLALAMVLSILSVGIVATSAAQADTADTAADINIAGAGSAYEDMLAQTTVENNYGLSKTVNDGTILQAWTWSFKNIESNLETIAEQGFTTIQVSPPNEIKKGTKGAKFLQNDGQNGWWMFYQPAGFQLNNSTDNALGTKAEFVSMCEKAHELGLKVIVDAVINHMGTKEGDDNNTSEDPMSHVTPKAKDFEPEIYNNKLFHSPWKKMQYIESNNTYYNSAYDLTRNCTSGLPDLKTEDTRVQTAIYDYMKELVEAGADGFRFDAAKHIETPDDHDGLGSSFWTNTLKKVQSQYSDKEIYAYGEILNTCGISRPYSWYTKLFDVTDSGSYWQIKNAVIGEYSGNPIPYYPSSNFTAANTMLWDESHDTYIDGATTSLSTVQRGKIWALVAGRAGISSVYLARPSDSTNKNDLYNITLGEARKTSWSNATTKAINQFHNYFIGQSEYCSNSNGTAYIERGTTGAMIVNLGGTTAKNVTLTNHKLTAGTYKDAITGNTFTVTKSQIKGSVGSTGVAVLYENNEAPKPTDPPAPTDPPETYILGDADGDGTVSSRDAVIVMRSSVGEADLTEKQQLAADVDGDGFITVIDATLIQRYIAKMSVKFDIGKEKTVQPVQPTTPTPIIIPTTPYEEPTEPDPEQGGTIIFSNNKGFSTVNIYYWSDSDQPVEWPGVPMTSIGMNEYGEERFTFDIPAGITNYIINDGSQQTVDVPFYGSTGVYMTDQDAEGHYNVEFYDITPDPTPTPGPDPDPDTEGSFLLTDNFGWGQAYVYAWDDDGNELYGAWPGSAQAETTQNEYGETQFRCYIPKGATGVILSNGNGEQTEDIKDFSYDGYWMDGSKNELGHYKVTGWNSDGSGGSVEPTPDYPVKSTFLLTDNFGWGSAYVYAWNAAGEAINGEWPGSAMAETTQNEYGQTQFKCNVPEDAVGVILSNGNGAQTEDITDFTYDGYWMDGSKNDQGHYLVTGWRSDGSGSGSGSGDPVPTPDPTSRTIIFSNNKGFGNVHIYYWGEGVEPVEWPGVAMTSIGQNEFGEERFTFEMPEGMTNYIITDGTSQTVDIPFTGATGVYMTNLNGEGKYEVDFYAISGENPTPEPTTAPTPVGDDGIYLVGTFSGWETNAQYKMSENPGAPGEYMISTTLTEGDGVKVVKVENGTQTWYPDGMDNEYTVDAAHAGNVTVYF
uniref:starch-binding protein n=1 Tax=uncultured Ruminococcus sp. TaxID=165186 RepID=UPI00292EE230